MPEHLGAAIAEEVTSRLTAACTLDFGSAAPLASTLRTSAPAAQVAGTPHALNPCLPAPLAWLTNYRVRMEMVRVEDGTQIWVEDTDCRARRVARAWVSQIVEIISLAGGERLPDWMPRISIPLIRRRMKYSPTSRMGRATSGME